MAPEVTRVPGPLGIEGMDEEVYRIGIANTQWTLPGVEKLDRERNPLVSLPRATQKTIEVTGLFLVGLGKLASGDVGADKLTGPIGIAEIARSSLDLGSLAYLQTMILISINLGILNLLPIPVLDGGQALLFTVEGVKRSPMSMRTRELVQSLGLGVLLMLMGLAFWNDLSRHWGRFVEWLGGTGL
jgi:regulator of sigma E protease